MDSVISSLRLDKVRDSVVGGLWKRFYFYSILLFFYSIFQINNVFNPKQIKGNQWRRKKKVVHWFGTFDFSSFVTWR